MSAKLGGLELEFVVSMGAHLWNLSSWLMYKDGGSLESLSLKVWRSFGNSCFSCVMTVVLVVNVKGFV